MKLTEYNLSGYQDKYTRVWGAQSESNPNKIYTVALNRQGVWSCGCPRWTMNRERPNCKHITYAKQLVELGELAESTARAIKSGAWAVETRSLEPMPEQVRRKLSTFSAIEL